MQVRIRSGSAFKYLVIRIRNLAFLLEILIRVLDVFLKIFSDPDPQFRDKKLLGLGKKRTCPN